MVFIKIAFVWKQALSLIDISTYFISYDWSVHFLCCLDYLKLHITHLILLKMRKEKQEKIIFKCIVLESIENNIRCIKKLIYLKMRLHSTSKYKTVPEKHKSEAAREDDSTLTISQLRIRKKKCILCTTIQDNIHIKVQNFSNIHSFPIPKELLAFSAHLFVSKGQ